MEGSINTEEVNVVASSVAIVAENPASCTCCVVCLDPIAIDPSVHPLMLSNGVLCSKYSHILCKEDLNRYCVENVFPKLFQLKRTSGLIVCPGDDCCGYFDPLVVYQLLETSEAARYLRILHEVVFEEIAEFRHTAAEIRDSITLRCPNCSVAVDPSPDACSAVMCLACAGYYCNYCFAVFSTGDGSKDRAAAHVHAAEHKEVAPGESSDAFLALETVQHGQHLYHAKQLRSFLSAALIPHVPVTEQVAEDAVMKLGAALLLCHEEINSELAGGTCFALWTEALATHRIFHHGELGADLPESAVPAAILSPNSEANRKSNEAMLASALLTDNKLAATQIMSMVAHHKKKLAEGGSTSVAISREVSSQLPAAVAAATLSESDEAVAIELLADDISPLGIIRQRSLTRGVSISNAAPFAASAARAATFASFDPNFVSTDEGGVKRPLLLLALLMRQVDVAIQLVQMGADAFSCPGPATGEGHCGRSALYVAIELGLVKVIEEIAKQAIVEGRTAADWSAPLTTEANKYSAMHICTVYNRGNLVQLFFDQGADIDADEAEYRFNPLFLALNMGHDYVAEALLDAGADPARICGYGRAPLAVAIERGLSHQLQRMVERRPELVNAVLDSEGQRPIHIALQYKQLYILQRLVTLGADLNILDPSNYPPVTLALLRDDVASSIALMRLGCPLVVAGQARQATYVATERGLLEAIRCIAEVNPQLLRRPCGMDDGLYVYPLQVALRFRQAAGLKLLLSLGAATLPNEWPADEEPDVGPGCRWLDLVKEATTMDSALDLLFTLLQEGHMARREAMTSTDTSTWISAAIRADDVQMLSLLCSELDLLNTPEQLTMGISSVEEGDSSAGLNAIQLACEQNSVNCLYYLLRKGADPVAGSCMEIAKAAELTNTINLLTAWQIKQEKLTLEGSHEDQKDAIPQQEDDVSFDSQQSSQQSLLPLSSNIEETKQEVVVSESDGTIGQNESTEQQAEVPQPPPVTSVNNVELQPPATGDV